MINILFAFPVVWRDVDYDASDCRILDRTSYVPSQTVQSPPPSDCRNRRFLPSFDTSKVKM